MKKILITGGYGYIGSHIAVELVRSEYEVVIIDNLSNSKIEVGSGIDAITGKTHIFCPGDILDKDFLQSVFDTHTIDVVVYCAAKKAVGESCEIPYTYYETNIHGTATLLDVMEAFEVRKILFSSSTTVYDTGSCSSPFDETMPIGGTSSPYGTTKVINEMMLKDYSMHKGCSVLSLRYFNPIGADTSGLIGEDPAQPPQSLLPVLLQTLTGQREQMSVYGSDYDTPDGTCLRDYIHVSDVALGHVDAIKYLLHVDTPSRETVNLGTGTPTSVLDMIHHVEAVTGCSVPRLHTDRRAGDVPVAFANPTKAKNLLGWEPRFTINQGVQDAWKFRNTHISQ